LYNLGEAARSNLVNNGFMPSTYDPRTVFVRGPNDNASIISGYAYLMGLYPKTIEGVDLMPSYDDLSSIPITGQEVDGVRYDINSVRPQCGYQRVDFYPGNDDKEFLIKPMELYPGLRNKLISQLDTARVQFEQRFGNRLYEELGRAMGKDSNRINFANTLLYLDDYMSAKENYKNAGYELSPDTRSLVVEYYKHYYRDGYFRDDAVNKLMTDSYFRNLGKELLLKEKSVNDDKNRGSFIQSLKHIVHVGNHQTFVAILHQLGERSDYTLDFAQKIDWQLFDRNGVSYVKGTVNGYPLDLEGNANSRGEVEFSVFFEYLCSKLYYGDKELVASGAQNPDNFDNMKIRCHSQLESDDTIHNRILLKPASSINDDSKQCDPSQEISVNMIEVKESSSASPSPSYSTNNYNSAQSSTDGGWSSSFKDQSSSSPSSSSTQGGWSSSSGSSSSSSGNSGATYTSLTPNSESSRTRDSYYSSQTAPSSSSSSSSSSGWQTVQTPAQPARINYNDGSSYRAYSYEETSPQRASTQDQYYSYQQSGQTSGQGSSQAYSQSSSSGQVSGQSNRSGQAYNEANRGYIPETNQDIQTQTTYYKQQPTEMINVKTVTEPASILKSLVDSSPTYDVNERAKMNAPSGSVTYVPPLEKETQASYPSAGMASRGAISQVAMPTQYGATTGGYRTANMAAQPRIVAEPRLAVEQRLISEPRVAVGEQRMVSGAQPTYQRVGSNNFGNYPGYTSQRPATQTYQAPSSTATYQSRPATQTTATSSSTPVYQTMDRSPNTYQSSNYVQPTTRTSSTAPTTTTRTSSTSSTTPSTTSTAKSTQNRQIIAKPEDSSKHSFFTG
jgi:hypothetical protein